MLENSHEYQRSFGEEPIADRVYVSHETGDLWGEGAEEYWTLADNYEVMGVLGRYRVRDESWYYAARRGETVPQKMKDGQTEALSNASIFFTG